MSYFIFCYPHLSFLFIFFKDSAKCRFTFAMSRCRAHYQGRQGWPKANRSPVDSGGRGPKHFSIMIMKNEKFADISAYLFTDVAPKVEAESRQIFAHGYWVATELWGRDTAINIDDIAGLLAFIAIVAPKINTTDPRGLLAIESLSTLALSISLQFKQ